MRPTPSRPYVRCRTGFDLATSLAAARWRSVSRTATVSGTGSRTRAPGLWLLAGWPAAPSPDRCSGPAEDCEHRVSADAEPLGQPPRRPALLIEPDGFRHLALVEPAATDRHPVLDQMGADSGAVDPEL
jgi:hypothetical protein